MAMDLNVSRWRNGLKKVPFAVPLVRLVKLIRATLDPQQRSIWALQRDPQAGLLQPSPVTSPDRYPALFALVRDQLASVASPVILSYGCSVGDEVFSLSRLIPEGRFKGIDINPASIKLCEKRKGREGATTAVFACAASPTAEPDGHYDAIFCMAVLRHGALQGPMPDRCDAHIRFDDVAALVTDLARCLKPGGLFIAQNCHFRFADMPVAAQFDLVFSDRTRPRANHPLYGPDNVRLDVPDYTDAVFCKHDA